MLKLVTVRFTDGALVVIQPKGRFVMTSYQNGAAFPVKAASDERRMRVKERRFFFIYFHWVDNLPRANPTLGVAERQWAIQH